MALIENIQREDLNPMEAAAGLSAAGRRVPPDAGRHRRAGRQGSRDGGELPAPAEAARRSPRQRRVGRALDGPRARDRRARPPRADQRRLARDVVSRGLSVRETEALVKKEIGDKRGADDHGADQAEEGRAHARGRRAAAHLARHAGRDQAQGQGRHDRDRVHERERAAAALRVPDGAGAEA